MTRRLRVSVFSIAVIACLIATAFTMVKAAESAPSDLSVVFVAPETRTQRDLRFVRGLIDLGLNDMAASEAMKLALRLSDSSLHVEKRLPENTNAQMDAISLALKATVALWTVADSSRRTALEKSVVDLRRMVEGTQAAESVFVVPGIGDESAKLRYAAAILEYNTSRATVLRCQNQSDAAGRLLQPLVTFDFPQSSAQTAMPDDWRVDTSTVQRRMEYLFAQERFREEAIQCGVIRRDTPRKATSEFANGLTQTEAELFDVFVKYLDLRAARFDGRREDATACLTALTSTNFSQNTSLNTSHFTPGIEAERLRLAVLDGKASELFAVVVPDFGKEPRFALPVQDDILTKMLHDDRELARFEFLLAVGKDKNSNQEIQQRITRQLEIVKSSCSPVVSCQVETLLGISGQHSTDAGMTETAAESAWRAGRIDEAVSLYDAASARALTANKRADAFRLAAAAAAILKQRLDSNTPAAGAKSDIAARLDLLNRFVRLGREYPDEKHAIDFLSAGLDLAVGLLKSGNFSFDEYLKLRIEFLLRSTDSPQKEEFRFRTIALALGNHRAEPAILLLKENPACSQVSQAMLAVVAEGLKKILFGEEPLPQPGSLREVAELFLLWDTELKKDRSVPLHWSELQSRTLESCRAQALFLTGQVSDAFKQFALLLKSDPNDQDVLVSLATILSERTTDAEIDRAIELWSRVAAGNANGSARVTLAREQLVLLLKRRGRNEQADQLKRLIELEKGESK
ncbi:MAG: hypothetical protein Q4G59_02075 [Planctomycetia bacterium]|nr:hypothetical protein [Planctomycetia bacterium]